MKALWRFLQFFGAAGLITVALTHVAETLHLFPGMGWGQPDSAGQTYNACDVGRTRHHEGACVTWEGVMPTLVGFGTFAALPEEQISEKISRRILSGEQGMSGDHMLGAVEQ